MKSKLKLLMLKARNPIYENKMSQYAFNINEIETIRFHGEIAYIMMKSGREREAELTVEEFIKIIEEI